MDNVNRALWQYVINKGGIVTDKSFYGWSFKDKRPTYNSIKNDIDWSETSPIVEDMVSQFNGTFASYHNEVKYLYGDIVYKNGKTESWGLRVDCDITFHGIIGEVLDFMNEY